MSGLLRSWALVFLVLAPLSRAWRAHYHATSSQDYWSESIVDTWATEADQFNFHHRSMLHANKQVIGKQPGSRPPQCQTDLPGQLKCEPRPVYLHGSHGLDQHAVWVCTCE